MAENDSEKTEHESQKKLEDSRKKGELPRSQELTTLAALSLFMMFFAMSGLNTFEQFGDVMRDLLNFNPYLEKLNQDTVLEFLLVPMARTLGIFMPMFLMVLVFSPLITLSQTGFNIADEKLQPSAERLNPVAGFKRMFSTRQFVEGFKSCLKIMLFALLAYRAIVNRIPEIHLAVQSDIVTQLELMLDLSMAIGIRIAVLLAALSVADYGYQWWEFKKKLRMTHQELKDEMKEREGNPLIKQRQRSLAMQRAREAMMNAVAQADVIVTNPTHYAVAICYNQEKAPAPYVCAKGQQAMAFRIREKAKQHGIPIIENKPLARALFKKVKVNQVIPNDFFKAVAEVLAFVYLLKHNKNRGKINVMRTGQKRKLAGVR